MTEKIARLNRTTTARDMYDLAWLCGLGQLWNTLDKPLIRRLAVLKIWIDANGIGAGGSSWGPAHVGTSFDPERWLQAPAYRDSGVEPVYRAVTDGLDALLAKHGYERGDHLYRAVRPNTENLLLFCHFGVECVLLSRLFDCSPVTLWHHTVALPSSVTVVTTEEREKGTAIFRMSRFADLSHLDAAGEAPSFFARFCEQHGDGTREN